MQTDYIFQTLWVTVTALQLELEFIYLFCYWQTIKIKTITHIIFMNIALYSFLWILLLPVNFDYWIEFGTVYTHSLKFWS